jgi:hypothetical protein
MYASVPYQTPYIRLTCRLGVAVGHARDSEIQNLRLAALIHHNVARFQIPVNDEALVGMVYGLADLSHQLQPLARVQLMRFRILQQRFSLNELHREIGLRPASGIGSAGFMDLGNARVLQPAKRLRFLLEPPQHLGAGSAGFDDLKCHPAAGLFLFGLIYHPHAAFTQEPQNPIPANGGRQSRLDSVGRGNPGDFV